LMYLYLYFTVVNAEMLAMWGKDGLSYMQLLYFSYALGGLASPLYTMPFLQPANTLEGNATITMLFRDRNLTNRFDALNNIQVMQDTPSNNISHIENKFTTTTATVLDFEEEYSSRYGMQNVTNSDSPIRVIPDLYLAYTISAVICMSLCFTGLVMYCFHDNDIHGYAIIRQSSTSTETPTLSKTLKVCVLVTMGSMSFLYIAIEQTFSGFLSTFTIQRLHFNEKQGSLAISLFYSCIALGRFAAIVWVRWINPHRVMGVFTGGLVFTLICLCLVGYFRLKTMFWSIPILAGLLASTLLSNTMTWTEEYFLPVTGFVSAYLIAAACLGGIVNPVLVGYLIDKYQAMCYTYILLIESIMLFITYIAALRLQKIIQFYRKESTDYQVQYHTLN